MRRHEVAPAARGWQGDRLVFGCDYNPEQWAPEVWRTDVALMREAGIELVAINIFGWASIQPAPGTFDFAALDEIIALLHDAGIRINLGTGTSSPPPWLAAAHPEILPVVADGTTRWPGGRQAWCPSSPVFRAYALEVVEAVAKRYGQHPAVALWHISNELGCHNARCYCDESAIAFRRWLGARYGTVAELNRAWGTSFWSQRYGAFSEVLPPRATLSIGNPAQALDFARFSSDELLEYYRAETAVVRASSSVPVTTNFMVTAHIRSQDYWGWAADMDLIANDHYLDHRLGDPFAEAAFAADLTRGLANGEPWMLMETSTSAVSWQPRNIAKTRAELLRTVTSHVARGADAVCFFQWRASAQGAEKFHSALLPHAGTDSTGWQSTLAVSELLRSLAGVTGSRVESDVALVFGWESWWAAEGPAHPTADVTYLDQVHRLHAALVAAGVTVDIVPPGAPLDGYSLVAVPALYLASDDDIAAIERFVDGGGSALVTFFSGITDESDRVRLDPSGATPPGGFARLLGAWTDEFLPLAEGETVGLDGGATGSLWSERVRVTSAEVVQRFVGGRAHGHPAITTNRFGAGRATYVATTLDPTSLAALAAVELDAAGVSRMPLPAGVERVVRRSNDASYTFVINGGATDVTLDARGHDLVTGTAVAGRLTVPSGAVRVVREAN